MKIASRKQYPLLLVMLAFVGSWPFWAGALQSDSPEKSKGEHTVMATLWYQTSAEFRAICYQTFQFAKLLLDNDLKENTSAMKRAIIVDIDETVLDNSPHTAMLIKENKTFPYRWDDWVNLAQASPLPGAVEFLSYAASKGVDIYYISNRTVDQLDATMKNLQNTGFPQVQKERVLLKEKESSKESRRQQVARDHRIVLLMGDNLNDLSKVFEKKSIQDRLGEVDRTKELFGSRYLVLPNPIYGEWESAVYEYNYSLSDSEKDLRRKQVLKGF